MKVRNMAGDLILIGERYLFPGGIREIDPKDLPVDERIHVVGEPDPRAGVAVGATEEDDAEEAGSEPDEEPQKALRMAQKGRGRRKSTSKED